MTPKIEEIKVEFQNPCKLENKYGQTIRDFLLTQD